MQYPGSLHNHTQYSNLKVRDCIIKEKDLINRALELGHSVVAITDHECISSAVGVEKIYNKVKENNPNFKVIRGNEIYLCRDGLNNENFSLGEDKYYHFILLAKDRIGFEQICELSTRAWMRSYMGRGLRRTPTYYQDIIDIIGKNPGHVIGSTACLGSFIAAKLLEYKELNNLEQYNQAEMLWNKTLNWCNAICSIFGGKENFYLELQPSASEEQTYVNRKLIEISNLLNLDYIITCDSHYLRKEDREIHKAYLNSQSADREVDAFYATTYLMDTKDLKEHLTLSEEEIEKAFNSIIKIQNLCEDYSILKPLNIPTLKWKDYSDIVVTKDWIEKIPYFDTFLNSDYIGDRILVQAIIKGILSHPDLQNERAYNELNSNLKITWESSLVNKAHWSAYYLNLQKIIDLCWEANSIVGPGRGSGVGFLLLYCLDITQINPLEEKTQLFSWRFLNPERVSVLDIDFDIEGGRRSDVLNKFREYYGEDRVANVLTLKTEGSKSAILTAARGLEIDVDIAQYLASLIPSDRGQVRSLSEVFYGDEEKDFKPISSFVNEMTNNYPELWEIAQKIEGLICGCGIHAGGVIFVDEPFTKSTALMRAPNGTIMTQFDLHSAEDCSLIKYDALSVEAMDKIHICLDLLLKDKLIENKGNLKDTYEAAIGVYNLERENKDMWKMVWEHKILSLFQMEQQSGINGIALTKPQSIDDLATLNSVIRLMAQEKGGEQPLNKYARFKQNPELWYEEMSRYGLTKEEMKILEPVVKISYGICEAQERFMQLVQLPECGGFNLNWADKLRKSIAKKNPEAYLELEKEYFKVTEEKGLSKNLCNYVWNVLVATSRGYGFNLSHTLAYSLVALQEMNLAYRFPILYWNCACLISDSGSNEQNSEKGSDYAKMAKALGDIINKGIKISLIDINKSSFSFEPDIENNQILFGMKALSNIGGQVIEQIVSGRPYLSFKDFLNRCPLNKSAMISLIKAGAFDNLELDWAKELSIEPRVLIMIYYLSRNCDAKKKLTLQNFNGLLQHNMIPQDLEFQKRVYVFNKYLKAETKVGKYYVFNAPCIEFYNQFFDIEELDIINGLTCILQTKWDKIYKDVMDAARNWLKENQEKVLKEFNYILFKEAWDKYANGTISAWEMETLCFYYHEHELANIDTKKYGISDFFSLPSEPEIEYFLKRNKKEIPIYVTHKIMGTVISKDDNHSSISLLTTTGVVTVKFTKEYYAMYKKQISEKQEDGTKKVMEKGWMNRGTKLMLTGFRRGDQFVAKSYKHTPTHQLYRIEVTDNGKGMELYHERFGQEEN